MLISQECIQKKVAAVLDNYGQDLDMNANILVEYENGVHGVYSCSQVCAGHINGLLIRIFGTKGSIVWYQEDPEHLMVTRKGEPNQIYSRGAAYGAIYPKAYDHIPAGHPEGLTYAFANIYGRFMSAVLKSINGEEVTPEDLDFPSAEDGVYGVKFIQAVVKSSGDGSVWVEL